MDSFLRSQIEQLSPDGQPLGSWDWDPDSGTLFTGVTLQDEDGMEVESDVQFQVVDVTTAGASVPYLVLTWVMVPPSEMVPGPETKPGLLGVLDDLNGEPGVKFRLQTGPDGQSALVCEADLPAEFVNEAWLLRAFVRCREAVAKYSDPVQFVARV